MTAFSLLKDSWRNRDKLGNDNHTRELAAFLPAALEIQESPPNPLVRWLAWSLLALVIVGIAWASFGKVNIVASAEGKIIPSSRVKQIQPMGIGVVKKILVKEGQHVSKGQALIELDGTSTGADEKRLAGELHSAQLQLAVSRAFLNILDMPLEEQAKLDISSTRLPADFSVSSEELVLHKRMLWQQWQHYRGQLQALYSSLDGTRADQAATGEVVKKLEQTLPIITRRAATMEDLYAKKYSSEVEYLQLEQQRIEQIQDLAAERQRLKRLKAAERETEQQARSLTAQIYAEQLANMAETQRQIASLSEELAKASNFNAQQILYSPVSGQVQELVVNTIGGVVTAAQQLMLIVPDQEQLEVEVFLENKDIGFVREGMLAEIKIHTFPFTKYGIIDGEVITVSNDATVDEKRGLIYGMRLLMAQNTISVEGKDVRLMPGMAVTAEVQIGHRRIIEFFLSPLLRHSEESLRER